jgi:hypothetical protein
LDFSKILANFATWINEDENYAAELQLLAINVYRLPITENDNENYAAELQLLAVGFL